jgi:hypothetical protein
MMRRQRSCGTGRSLRAAATVVAMVVVLVVSWSIAVMAETTPLAKEQPDAISAFFNSGVAIKEWTIQGTQREFFPENLSRYINGQADMYIRYAFVKVGTAVYGSPEGADRNVTVDIYDMGSALGAFGIYAQMDSGDLKSAGVGAASYVLAPSLAFYKWRYFVMINASFRGAEAEAALTEMARLVDGELPGDNSPPSEALLLPQELPLKLKRVALSVKGTKLDVKAPTAAKRVPGTLHYIPKSLLGQEFLPRGMEAEYKIGEEKVKLFIAFFKTADDAAKGLGAYKQYVSEKGKAVSDTEVDGAKGFSAEDPYQGNVVIVQYDKWLVGATKLKAVDDGKPLVEQLLAVLKKK